MAGLSGDDEIEVVATPGEIRLRRANGRVIVEFTKSEAVALAAGKLETKAAEAALSRVRKLVAEQEKGTHHVWKKGYSEYPVDFRLQLAGFDESHHG